jgi:alkylation response protein AidB-like acyl-CoA dehydrogenase
LQALHRPGAAAEQAARAAFSLLDSLRHAIPGGTTEIQENTIAERLLGLRREGAARPG